MDAKDFFSQFKTPPILFLGAGISKRYYNGAYSWDELLRKISKDIHEDDKIYLNIKNRHIDSKTKDIDYASIATELESALENLPKDVRESRFPKVEEIFFNSAQEGIKQSRIKIHATIIISNLKVKDDEITTNEIKALKASISKINSIITTNYDTFIEDNIAENTSKQEKLGVIIGNDIILSSPYGSIYKIHGCVNNPDTLIITKEDYAIFEQEYEIIKAHLLSLFAHNPVIFMGYSLIDPNIKSILRTIFKAIKPKSDLSKKIQKNFLIVEYQQNNTQTILESHSIDIEGVMIEITKIRTDNFIDIYNHISNLDLTISPHEIKVFNTINKVIQQGGDRKVVLKCNIDDLDSKDRVICISTEQNKTVTTVQDLIQDYFDYMDKKEKLPNNLDKLTIGSNILFPAYGYSKISSCPKIHGAKSHQEQKINKLKKSNKNNNNNIKELLKDHKTKDQKTILTTCSQNEDDLNTLEMHLRENMKELKSKDNQTKVAFIKNLLIIYDFIKYGETKINPK